jgi:hypothetical protein
MSDLCFKSELFWIDFYRDDRVQERFLLLGNKKVEGGILHLVQRYSEPLTLEQCQAEIEQHGKLCSRPYRVGDPWSAEIECCVLSLFFDCCRALQQDAKAILNEGVELDELITTDDDIATDKAFAQWQGVEYPPSWDSDAIKQLMHSLEEINYSSLIDKAAALLTKVESVYEWIL